MIETRIWVDGVITDEQHAVVPVLDRGFLYGDSIYEVTRTAGGRPVDLGPHLERLARSARAIHLALPATIERAIAETLAAAGVRPGPRDRVAGAGDAYLRVVVTRGGGPIGLDIALADRPRVVVIVKAVSPPTPESYARGVSVAIVGRERVSPRALDPAAKSGNYLNNILALTEARQARQAYEALMLDAAGRVAECSTSNVWVVQGGRVRTPAPHVGLLPGITRWRLMQLAAEVGIPVEEADLTVDDVLGADELFLTSSIRGVLGVSSVYADGVPDRALPVGPVTRRLGDLYEGFLDRVAAGRA